MISIAIAMDESEFETHLEQQGFSSERHSGGWLWRPNIGISLSDKERSLKAKIKHVLVEMAFQLRKQPSLIQFWAIEQQQQQQHLYLTTLDEPFVVGAQVLYGYRQRCMGHRIRVDEGADEEELGAVGRVYRNRRPESSPDLRFYSTNEFPFRDDADACGITSYCALPVFDFEIGSFYGVIEVLQLKSGLDMFAGIHLSLEPAKLRTTHHNFNFGRSIKDVDREIVDMLQWAKAITPQLQMAHLWTPCTECSITNSNLSCMQRRDTIMNSEDNDMRWYGEACEFHHLYTKVSSSAVMWSGNKPRICQNVCDYRISENPLAHYAQKARLSFCFAVRLQNSRREFRVVEFFLQCNSREDEFSKSCLPLLLSIMEMKLKTYKFAYDGELGEELKVEVVESSGLRYESIKYEHQHSKELSMLKAMEGHGKNPPSDDKNYLINGNLHYSKPSAEQRGYGWVFWSQESEKICENQSSLGFDVQERIKFFMKKIASRQVMSFYAVAQFWAPKLDGNRCYLEVSGQPFALGQLKHNGSAKFRKQCMGHRYYVNGDGSTKKDKLGPPGRVYLNGHPEITPDLRLYSPAEFPLRDDAASYGLRSYVALPIFELNKAECVGVLELLSFYDDMYIKVVGEELEAASLSSTHTTNFRPSPLSGNNDRELALTEIRQACEVFAAIPQLYMVEVLVPYDKCPSNNNTNFCMERVLTTEREENWDPPIRGVQRVQTGKGIAGMALASENKACFSQHSCRFSITDQPLAHFTRRARLDVCFAICLQSRHTGDLVYILHFYLNGSCRKYKYFKTFLCLLLQKIRQTLKSFKVASGQDLGEKLVVEVIEFSQVSELDFSESDQPDGLPVTFKFVNYLAQGHSEVESVGIVAQEERGQCTTATTNSKIKDTVKEIEKRKGKRKKAAKEIEERKGKIKDTAKEIEERKGKIKDTAEEIEGRKGKVEDTAEEIEGRKGKIKDTEKEIEGRKGKIKDTEKETEVRKGKIEDTAEEIEGRKGKIEDTEKEIEGRKGMIKDTEKEIEGRKRKKRKITFEMLKPLFGMKLEDAAKILGVHKSTIKRVCRENKMIGWPWKENHKNNLSLYMEDQNMSNLPPALVMADPQSSRPTVEPKVDMVVIKAKYEDDIIRVELCRSEGLEKLMTEVGRRHKLSVGSFKLKYIDEDNEEILLACDDDLQLSLKIPIATKKPYLQVFVKLIDKPLMHAYS